MNLTKIELCDEERMAKLAEDFSYMAQRYDAQFLMGELLKKIMQGDFGNRFLEMPEEQRSAIFVNAVDGMAGDVDRAVPMLANILHREMFPFGHGSSEG